MRVIMSLNILKISLILNTELPEENHASIYCYVSIKGPVYDVFSCSIGENVS